MSEQYYMQSAQELWEQMDKELLAEVEKEASESEEYKELVGCAKKAKHYIPGLWTSNKSKNQ